MAALRSEDIAKTNEFPMRRPRRNHSPAFKVKASRAVMVERVATGGWFKQAFQRNFGFSSLGLVVIDEEVVHSFAARR